MYSVLFNVDDELMMYRRRTQQALGTHSVPCRCIKYILSSNVYTCLQFEFCRLSLTTFRKAHKAHKILQELFSFDDNGIGNMIKSSLCFCLATQQQKPLYRFYRLPHTCSEATLYPASTHQPYAQPNKYNNNNLLSERERNVSCGGD